MVVVRAIKETRHIQRDEPAVDIAIIGAGPTGLTATYELTGLISACYWIRVADREYPLIAVAEHTNLLPRKDHSRLPMNLFRHADKTSIFFHSSDERLGEQFINALQPMFPYCNQSTIPIVRANRDGDAQPGVYRGYSCILAFLATPIDNRYLACLAQIYPEGRKQNDTIRMGVRVAQLADGRNLIKHTPQLP